MNKVFNVGDTFYLGFHCNCHQSDPKIEKHTISKINYGWGGRHIFDERGAVHFHDDLMFYTYNEAAKVVLDGCKKHLEQNNTMSLELCRTLLNVINGMDDVGNHIEETGKLLRIILDRYAEIEYFVSRIKVKLGAQDDKINELVEQIRWIHRQTKKWDTKIVIFVNDSKTRKIIAQKLSECAYKVVELKGKDSYEDIEVKIQQFKDLAKILVLTDLFATGINLAFADGLINYGIPKDEATRCQRRGRVERLKDGVLIYKHIVDMDLESNWVNQIEPPLN